MSHQALSALKQEGILHPNGAFPHLEASRATAARMREILLAGASTCRHAEVIPRDAPHGSAWPSHR
jgi:hypothetical protein